MSIYYVDPENGTDTQAGNAIIKHTGLNLDSATNIVTVPDATGIVVGMKVLSGDLQNTDGNVNVGTTVAAVGGNEITLSENVVASTVNGTLIFSAAFKTLSAGAAAAGPGDTVRIKRSKDPVNTGITGTWTHLGTQIALSEPATVTLDNCDVAWAYAGERSASYFSNVLNTRTTSYLPSWNLVVDTATAAQGTGRLRLQWYWPARASSANLSAQNAALASFAADVNGSFTLLYQNFASPLDLTNSSRLSMWYSNTWPAKADFGTMKLELCTEHDGVGPVGAVIMPYQSQWSPRVLTNYVNGVETAIGAVVKSIRVYIDGMNLSSTYTDYNSSTSVTQEWNLYLDNIVACLPDSNPKAITHNSLIGKNKNREHWLAISYIDDTVIGVDTYGGTPPGSGSYPGRGYTSPDGTTEAYAIWRRGTLDAGTLGAVTFGKNGSKTSPITYSGGWDDETMSTQTGHSFFRSDYTAESITFSGDFNILENVAVIRSTSKAFGLGHIGWVGASGFGNIIRNSYGIANRGGVVIQDSGIVLDNVRNTNTFYSGLSVYQSTADGGYSRLDINNCSFDGSEANGSNTTAGHGLYIYPQQYHRYRQVDNIRISNCSLANNRNGAIQLGAENRTSSFVVMNSRLDGSPTGTYAVYNLIGDGKFVNCAVPEATPISFGTENGTRCYFQGFNQVNNNNRVYDYTRGLITSFTDGDRMISTGLAWRLSPLNTNVNVLEPLVLPLCQVYVDKDRTVTFTAYMRRDSLTTYGRLVCRGGQIGGITDDAVVDLTGDANTWVQVTLTLNPTQSGVIEIEAHAWGGAVNHVDVDNISVSQA